MFLVFFYPSFDFDFFQY